MPAKHVVIAAHPKMLSFTLTIARAYCDAVRERGNEAILRDLYRVDFDPRLAADEMPADEGFAARADVKAERELLQGADAYAFVYPLWFNAPPAMLKGYLDRVFGFGFAYTHGRGGMDPLLGPSKMISFTSSGAPTQWVTKTGAWNAIRTLFDEHFAAVCGLTVVDHVHFGAIASSIRPDVVERHIETTRLAVAKHF